MQNIKMSSFYLLFSLHSKQSKIIDFSAFL